jgi:hypothetical protein
LGHDRDEPAGEVEDQVAQRPGRVLDVLPEDGQEQQPCEVVVLSLVATREAKLSPLELMLGAATAHTGAKPKQ